jgi:hypothetical protein
LGSGTTSTRQFNLPEENPVSKDLGKPKITPKTPTTPPEPKGRALITKNQMNNTTLSYMKEKGFELVGLDEKGNFKFEKR